MPKNFYSFLINLFLLVLVVKPAEALLKGQIEYSSYQEFMLRISKKYGPCTVYLVQRVALIKETRRRKFLWDRVYRDQIAGMYGSTNEWWKAIKDIEHIAKETGFDL